MKFLICSCIVFVFVLNAREISAQDRFGSDFSLGIGWGLSIPVGSNLMSKTTYMVPALEGEWRFSPLFSAGMSVVFASGKERRFTRDRYEGSMVDGYSHRERSALTLLLKGRWYAIGKKDDRLQPYLSLAGGMELTRYKITGEQINTSRTREWSGVFRPGLGARYGLGAEGRFAIDLQCNYHYGGLPWKNVDVRRDNRMEIVVVIMMKL